MDETKVEEFMGQMAQHMTGAMVCASIWIGDELGLYGSLSGAGPITADELATRAGSNPRLTREWLDGQAAAGLVTYDAENDTYTLSDEAGMVLANDSAPTFMARGVNTFGAIYKDLEKIVDAFKADGAMAWGEHHPCMFRGTEWFFRPGYREFLPKQWIPAIDGMVEKLQAGASVADIGCGHGASSIAMALEFPNSRFHGFDFHVPSIETCRERAAEAGVAERTEFTAADAQSYDGTHDLICFFDCWHDMGDPLGAAQYAHEHLNEGGSVLLVEPFALDERAANIAENPMAAMFYIASTCICTPNSLSQDVGLGLGAQAGEARTRALFEQAGFSEFERVAETGINLVYHARA